MTQHTITLDVREDIRQGRQPLGRILQAVQGLQLNENLLLIAPFEPLPLFTLLAQQGFSHHARPTDSGDWEILFARSEETPARSEAVAPSDPSCSAERTVEVDVRGLEPPQPLVTILEALEDLPWDADMRAFTDRRPVHLYDHLEHRGYEGQTEQQHDGSFITTIRRV